MFVYAIVNSETLKIYIGKTINSDLHAYLRRKIWSSQTNRYRGRSYLFHAMQKYPSTVWSIHALFEGASNEEICTHEQFLIKALNARHPEVGYNLCARGEGHRVAPSPESRLKMSKARKGRTPWNKGKTGVFSEETLDKLKKAQTGRKYPPEFGQKVSAARKGIVFSKQHLYNLSESHKGKIPWNKGLGAR